jgi:hypothetical protein
MKFRNEHDNLTDYAAHLRQPQPTKSADGKPALSKVEYVKTRMIQGHPWVDGLHFGSERPNYWTHYLATSTSHLGVLVTFSVHRAHYEEYNHQFDEMIDSLNIYQR